MSILALAFTDSSISESYYFSGPLSIELTGTQDEIQQSDISSTNNPFAVCARLCLSSYNCLSLSHTNTVCYLYRVISSDTTSIASSRAYYEKITELTEPIRLSIANDGGDYIGTPGYDIVIYDGEDTGYIQVSSIHTLYKLFIYTVEPVNNGHPRH